MAETWSGRVGFILATIGSAIGLGSIWKFPYEVGQNGGGAFVLFYLLGLALVVLPLVLAEFALGRRGQGDAPASVMAVAGGGAGWPALGWMMVATGFAILSYYAVIGGQTLAYFSHAVTGGFAGLDAEGTRALYGLTVGAPGSLVLWQAVFMAASTSVVARGIGGGIEAACRILMPALVVLMVALVGYAAVEGDVARAASFLFAPRFEAFGARQALEALGLGFFSIGVGLGVMITYAAHVAPGTRLSTAALVTVAGDTAVSFLAGFAIFPLVFANGLDPAGGTSLMFLSLPIAFGRLPMGDVIGAGFFLALFVAALASAIALLELAVEPLMRVTGWGRRRVARLTGLACFAAGVPSALSFNLWQAARPLGWLPGFADANVMEVVDRLTSNLMLPAGGFFVSWLAGRALGAEGLAVLLWMPAGVARALALLLRWVVPGLILAFVAFGHLGD